MRKIYFLILGLVFISCQKNEDGNNLTAKLDNVEDGTKVYLTKYIEGNQPVPSDTTKVKNGEASFDLHKVDFQTLNSLTVEGLNGDVPFINENEPISITVYKDSLGSSKVDGGDGNEVMNKFRQLIEKSNQKLQKEVEEYSQEELQSPEVQNELQQKQAEIGAENTPEFIKIVEDYPDELPTIYVFGAVMNSGVVEEGKLQELYEGLSSNLKNTSVGQEIGKEFERVASISKGEKAPEFSATSPDGEEISLEDVLEKEGKYTLVQFWAAWCPNCDDEMPNVVEVYEEYHDKGLNIIGVSVDDDKEEWVAGIEKHGMDWPQVSNLKKWEDPIAQEYNVQSVPFNYLLDEDGKIVDADLLDEDLKNKMEELLGDE